jgi:capsular polysaccharide export protein
VGQRPGEDLAGRSESAIAHIGIMSPWILWRVIHLEAFLAEDGVPLWIGKNRRRRPGHLRVMAGWGYKRSSDKAREKAAQWEVPYWALEDGFIRSHRLGVEGATPLSVIVDPVGVYYDASRPSSLENLINACREITPEDLGQARTLMDLMRSSNIGKYNNASDLAEEDDIGRDRPLVVIADQTLGDYSLSGGNAGEAVLGEMLDAALDENPGADVRVRVHPDVKAGEKQSCLKDLAIARHIPLDYSRVSMASVLKRAARLYVATSNAGLEALIHGVPVTCFGMPFYAGWGLTDDRQHCVRRLARPSLQQVIAAAYLKYCRYVDPLTGRRTDALSIARHLALAKARAALLPERSVIGGVKRHKRNSVRSAFAAAETVGFAVRPGDALARARRERVPLLVWVGQEPAAWRRPADAVVPFARIEDGFLRSAGLGANRTAARSIVLDHTGIYFDPNRPSDLESMIEAGGFSATEIADAAKLRQRIVASRLSKYNVGSNKHFTPQCAPERRRLLVVGQVEDDASIILGSPVITTNKILLERVRRANPDAWILYKPHPDVEAGKRTGYLPPAELFALCDEVVSGWSIAQLFDAVSEVHTMTSLSGFEALLRGLEVETYGAPFYAGWGLTRDHLAFPRRNRRATLDELVAAALLRYSLYCDPEMGLPCDVWHVLTQLEGRLDISSRPRIDTRQRIANVVRALFGMPVSRHNRDGSGGSRDPGSRSPN